MNVKVWLVYDVEVQYQRKVHGNQETAVVVT